MISLTQSGSQRASIWPSLLFRYEVLDTAVAQRFEVVP